MLSAAEKQIKDEFSQDWAVYRLVTHETQPCKLWELSSCITYTQMLDMLEICETYDAINKVAKDKAKAQADKNRSK